MLEFKKMGKSSTQLRERASSMLCRLCGYILLAGALLLWAPQAAAADEFDDFRELDIANLLDTPVISASRRGQKLSEAQNAIYVITADDIERSGAVDLPDLLRMVPGVDVVNFNGNSYGVSSRGFNERYAQRMLVMVDGRNMYKTFFGNVFWESDEIFLEDIKQIEVIRGPGATMWGANSVSGVINIITKDPDDDQGCLAKAKLGSRALRESVFRYSDALSDRLSATLTAGYHEDSGNRGVHDSRQAPKMTGRLKYAFSNNAVLHFFAGASQGDASLDQSMYTTRTSLEGKSNYQMLRWNYDFGETSKFMLQAYRDYLDARSDDQIINAQEAKHDIEFQHSFEFGDQHYFLWGANYRNTRVESNYLPSGVDHDDTVGCFVQTELKLPNSLNLLAGTRYEDNSFTGSHWSPRISLLYTPWPNHHFRIAASRAYRTPSTNEARSYYSFIPVVALAGNDDLRPEKMTAYELSYRTRLFSRVGLNVECYYNELDNVIDSAFYARQLPITLTYANGYNAAAKGVEVTADMALAGWWRLTANYTYQAVENRGSGRDMSGTPRHKFNLWSSCSFDNGFALDIKLHFVDRTNWIELIGERSIDPYARLDVRVSQKLFQGKLEVSLVGQNLTDKLHPETRDIVVAYEIERLVYGCVTLRF